MRDGLDGCLDSREARLFGQNTPPYLSSRQPMRVEEGKEVAIITYTFHKDGTISESVEHASDLEQKAKPRK